MRLLKTPGWSPAGSILIALSLPFLVVFDPLFSQTSPELSPGNFVSQVIQYDPGSGFALDFSTGKGLTNVTAILGTPSRLTPGEFGGWVTPFSPPFLSSEILSIGDQGSITLQMSQPIKPLSRSYDLILFSNPGFIITNGNFSGGGITDGSLFGAPNASYTLSVSSDGTTFHPLTIPDGAGLNRLFPTDGTGDASLAPPSDLQLSDLVGTDLPQIRSLYRGSAGGAGFRLEWLSPEIFNNLTDSGFSFIRLEVHSGRLELDSVGEALRQPGTPSELISKWETFDAPPPGKRVVHSRQCRSLPMECGRRPSASDLGFVTIQQLFPLSPAQHSPPA